MKGAVHGGDKHDVELSVEIQIVMRQISVRAEEFALLTEVAVNQVRVKVELG